MRNKQILNSLPPLNCSRRCYGSGLLTLNLTLSPDTDPEAAHCPGAWIPIPAFWHALRTHQRRISCGTDAGCKAQRKGGPAGKTNGGLRRQPTLDCRRCRRGLPPLTLTASLPIPEGCPGTTSRTARPIREWNLLIFGITDQPASL